MLSDTESVDTSTHGQIPASSGVRARFTPVIRTFTRVVAGAGTMPYQQFVGYNVAGYFLGYAIPGVDRYLLPIITAIVVLSLLPVLWQVWRERRISEPVGERRVFAKIE